MKTQNKTQNQNYEFYKRIELFNKCIQECKYQYYDSKMKNKKFDITKCSIQCFENLGD